MFKAKIESQLKELKALIEAKSGTKRTDYSEYLHKPVEFIEDVLKITLTPQQKDLCQALLKQPQRLIARSGHGTGKTLVAASLSIWFFCTRPKSIVVITAPTFRQLQDCTFKEIRTHLPSEYKSCLSPKAPQVFDSPTHRITAFTSADANSFQGIHLDSIFIVFEEALGISADIITACKGICIGGDCYLLSIGNPTDSSSPIYLEEQTGRWNVIEMSSIDHPNIIEELEGRSAVIPSAVRLKNLLENMEDWGEWKTQSQHEEELGWTDVWFNNKWWRPDPRGFARILGKYPPISNYAIFSEADFRKALASTSTYNTTDIYEIGCDVARHGDDQTVIHVKRGLVSVHHETWVGQDTYKTAERLKELCDQYGEKLILERVNLGEKLPKITPYDVPVRIDDTGVGGGVVDQNRSKNGFTYRFIPVNYGSSPKSEADYPNKRSELLFNLRDQMRCGLNLSQLPKHVTQEIQRQAVTILYKLDPKGRRVAEPKADTKKRLGRSMDDLDAIALAYAPYGRSWEHKDISFEKGDMFDRFGSIKNPLLGGQEVREDRIGWS